MVTGSYFLGSESLLYYKDKLKMDATMVKACSTYDTIIHTEFLYANLKERDYWDDLSVDWRIILTLILNEQDGKE
jgi:hypothetical protein